MNLIYIFHIFLSFEVDSGGPQGRLFQFTIVSYLDQDETQNFIIK